MLARRMRHTKELLSTIPQENIWVKGKTRLAKIFYAVLMGDLTSIYLADMQGIDAEPVDIIMQLKERIGKDQ